MRLLGPANAMIGAIGLAGLLIGLPAGRAAVYTISPTDSVVSAYTTIQSAQAGDEVIIAPGTYTFRVYLTNVGTAAQPILIHAQDPNNKPVWDFSSTFVEDAPGSYTGGDNGRGGWQVSGGAYYQINDIIFNGCHTSPDFNSAGIRYYNGTTGLLIQDCIFRNNDNGLTGGSQNSDAIVQYCEFGSNGNLSATSPTHNMYIYGGTFTLRYCYVHDSVQAENFHIRAQSATLEYNWFARAANYEGDLMVDDDFSGLGPFYQSMTLRGNVFIQNTNPINHSQVVVAYNDTGLTNETLSLVAINNTYIGNGESGNGGAAAFINLSNADGTPMSAQVWNNIIAGTTVPTLVGNTAQGKVIGGNNWLTNGVSPGSLSNSVFAASPGFNNPAAKNFTLATNSPAIGQANQSLTNLPMREYYQNESNARQYRIRATAHDLGAFESTTIGSGINLFTAPATVTGIDREGTAIRVTWSAYGGQTNVVQSTATGSATSYSTNFLDLSPTFTLPGIAPITTNYLDPGGATNGPARFYRIRLAP
jgi:hypothetical protein